MTDSWDRPPPDVTPADLFGRWLPQAFAAAGVRAPPGAPRLRVSVGRDAWDLSASGDSLTIAAAGREAPDIWIRLSEADLRVALGAADPDLPVIPPEGWSMRDLLVIQPADVDLVRQIAGRIAV